MSFYLVYLFLFLAMLVTMLSSIAVLYHTVMWQKKVQTNLTVMNGALDDVTTTVKSIIVDQHDDLKTTQLATAVDLESQLSALHTNLTTTLDTQKATVRSKLQGLTGKILNIEKNLDKLESYFESL